MMHASDILLPNSETEADQLVRYFGCSREKISIVPNGVEESFATATPDAFIRKYSLKDFILCVGRIEPRKNQLNMIRALKETDVPFVVIGDYVPKYENYYEMCRREAGANVHFLGAIDHASGLLASAYAASKVFLLASWLETPGLAALEAGLAGSNVVITTEGATREYFGEFAGYAPPENLDEIRIQTLAALKKEKNNRLKEHIRSHFLWKNTAQKTLEAYQEILK